MLELLTDSGNQLGYPFTVREMQEMWVPSLGGEDPLKEEMATHSSILAWEVLWTEEPGNLQSMGSQRLGHNLATKQQKTN